MPRADHCLALRSVVLAFERLYCGLGASVDVLGGVVIRAALRAASLPPGCVHAGPCQAAGHACMHMGGRCPTARRSWVPHAEALDNNQSKHELDITRRQAVTEVNELRAQLDAVVWAIYIYLHGQRPRMCTQSGGC